MRFAFLYHSLESCWNHGNAHFLRGVVRDIVARGHEATVFEPRDGWSRANALRDDPDALPPLDLIAPGVRSILYDAPFDTSALDDFDVAIVHEWNDPALVAAVGARRAAGAEFTLFFHDTHHRAATAPQDIARLDLSSYDGALVFGQALASIYHRRGWAKRVFVWHEAADTRLFRPLPARRIECDLVWIGNWGDAERDAELREFLIEPIRALGLTARIYGVRYPESALAELAAAGIEYRGWLPNHRAPEAFAAARMTAHVPRRPYARALPGIPTIRMFEALACGLPLVSAPWDDCEGLFPTGAYAKARNGAEMTSALARFRDDPQVASWTAARGFAAIRERHSCAHRVDELLRIVAGLRGGRSEFSAARKATV